MINLTGSHAMPRYFFHIAQGEEVFRDSVGQEFPSQKAVLREAKLVAGELVRDAAFADRSLGHVLEVSDGNGNVILSFQCSDLEVVGNTGSAAEQ